MFNRTRWSAIGVAVAVTLAAGVALPSARATNTDGGGSGTVFVPIAPCRLFDTRASSTVGLRSAPLAAADTFTQAVTGANGNCVIPTQATGVAMNVTTVNATATSFLTVYPSDTPQPTASNLNWVANSPATPNKVDVKLSADGRINLFNNGGTVDVIADIVGYYTGHNHDDRYYTRDETDAKIEAADDGVKLSLLPPSSISLYPSLLAPGIVDPFTTEGCVGSANGVTEGRVPLVVPLGITFLFVSVSVLDGSGTFPMRVSLLKQLGAGTGLVTSELDFETFSGDATGTLFRATLEMPLTEVVDGSAVYEVSITGLGDKHNAFCGAALATAVVFSPLQPIP